MKKLFYLFIILLTFTLVSCQENKTFSFDEASITLNVGESKSLSYTSKYTVIFSLSKTGVITLENDTITAIGEGSVTITGTIKDAAVSKTLEVVVTKPSETYFLNFSDTTLNLTLNQTHPLDYQSLGEVVFTLSKEGVITLENDTITAIGEGSVVITGSIKDTTIVKTLEVVVTKPSETPSITFTESVITLEVNDIRPLSYHATGEVVFSLSIDGVITLENDMITALSAGSVKITGTIKNTNISKDMMVIVKEPPLVLERIEITGENERTVGSTQMLTFTLIPNTGDVVSWSSSDLTIASVDEGLVTAHQAGEVTITASVGEIRGYFTITIKDNTSIDSVEFYYLNDLHGAIEPGSGLGLAYIANYIEKRRLENPNLILIAGGDMLQGSALSNYYEGRSTLKLMDMMGFDAMVLGNHEFDWGLETVTDQFDPNTGSVSFPLLAINVREKATNQLPKNIKPYTLIEKNGLKVGVIGVIGEKLESSIANSRVKDYEFINALMLVKDAARQLRNEGAHFVTVAIHDQDNALNNAIAQLVGDEKVDAIFNAHYHRPTYETLYNKPILQAGANGSHIGYISLNHDGNQSVYNIDSHTDLNTRSSSIQNQIDIYKAETDPIFYDLIITNKNTKTTESELSDWLARLMRIKTGADIAFHNSGGTRADILAYEEINLAKLYQIWPFDNIVKTVKLKGSLVKQLMYNGSLIYVSDVTINNDTEYVVATNDYVFDHADNQSIFSQGRDHTNTGILLRDLAEAELKLQSQLYSTFDPSNPIQTVYTTKETNEYLYL